MILEYAAVKARIELDAALTGKVFDTARTNSTGLVRDQYVILFGGAPDELDSQRLGAASDSNSDATFTYTARSVGVTSVACLAVAEKVTTQLAGFVPVVTGRKFGPMRRGDGDGSARPDTTVEPAMFYLDQDFILQSLRA